MISVKNRALVGPKIVTDSVDPVEMQYYAAFHLGLHCLQKYSFRGFQITKGLRGNQRCKL